MRVSEQLRVRLESLLKCEIYELVRDLRSNVDGQYASWTCNSSTGLLLFSYSNMTKCLHSTLKFENYPSDCVEVIPKGKIKKPFILTMVTLKHLLSYDRSTGYFTWRTGRMTGRTAGCEQTETGLILIIIKGERYRADKLAFMYMLGVMRVPDKVEHFNGLPGDNRWVNMKGHYK